MKKIVSVLLVLAVMLAQTTVFAQTVVLAENSDFKYETVDSKIKITEYTGESTSVIIPEEIDELPVCEIGYEAFKGTSVTAVTVPETVTVIGDFAFAECQLLESISGGENVVKAGYHAFAGTAWFDLQADGTVYFGKVACDEKNNGDTVSVKDGTVSIASGAFEESKATKVLLPESLAEIGSLAFFASAIENIALPENLKTIGESAFENCTNLESVTIPQGVENLGEWVFANCTSLAVVSLDKNVKSIGEGAFFGCTSLASVKFSGTGQEWQTVVVGENNDALASAKFTFGGQTAHVPGDINDDGKVNAKDLTRLLKYLNKEDVEVVEDALDVNGDSKVNAKDLTRLLKYLNHEDVQIF